MNFTQIGLGILLVRLHAKGIWGGGLGRYVCKISPHGTHSRLEVATLWRERILVYKRTSSFPSNIKS